jgi:hypothetical protein
MEMISRPERVIKCVAQGDRSKTLYKLSGTARQIRWLGEGLGAQNEEIFKGLLDLRAKRSMICGISGVI